MFQHSKQAIHFQHSKQARHVST